MEPRAIEILPLDSRRRNGLHPPAHDSDGAQQEKVRLLVRSLLAVLGEDTEREGLRRTPQRMARMYAELLAGYRTDIHALVNGALFDVDYDEMVVVRSIDFYSLCEHHLLPFFGRAHVAYVPSQRVIGLSKIPRIVDMYARRLQVQERLTSQIAGQLEAILQPKGVAVVLDGAHLCTAMRGVNKPGAAMRTSVMLGCFRDDSAARAEFLRQLPAP